MKQFNGMMKVCAFILLVVLMASCKKEKDPYASYTPQREASLIKEWLAGVKLEKLPLDSTSTGIYYISDTTKVGTGPTVKSGDTVTVKYVGSFADGSGIFDASSYHSALGTMTYVHKTNRLIQGWEEGIEVMKKGSRATLLFPSAKAYGPTDYSSIPRNSPLLFVLEVIDIK